MLLLNILLIIALLGFVGAGMKDGFVHTLGRLVGSVLGFVMARSWSIVVGSFLSIFLPSGWSRFIAFILVFVLVTRLVGFVFKLADGAFRVLSIIPFLKSINNFLGGVLGVLEGIILLGGSIWIVLNFNLVPWLTNMLDDSLVANAIEKVFNLLLSFVL